MTREDDIMAKHLLKGGKMLSASCPACGCPLFEVKGETLCVVCAEKTPEGKDSGSSTEGGTPARTGSPAIPGTSSPLETTLEETLISLCSRIQKEKDPECVAALMEAVTMGIGGLNTLRSRETHR